MENLSRRQTVLLAVLTALTIAMLVAWSFRSGPIHWAQNRWEARKARQDSIAKVEREIIAGAMAGAGAGSDTVARGARAEQDTAPGLSEAVPGPRGFYLPKGAVQVGPMETDYFPHPEYTWTYRPPPGSTLRDTWEFYNEDLRNRGWEVRYSPVGWTFETGMKQWTMGREKIALFLIRHGTSSIQEELGLRVKEPNTFEIIRWRTEYEQ